MNRDHILNIAPIAEGEIAALAPFPVAILSDPDHLSKIISLVDSIPEEHRLATIDAIRWRIIDQEQRKIGGRPKRVRVTPKGGDSFEGVVIEERENSYIVGPDYRNEAHGHWDKRICEIISHVQG